MLPGGVNFKDTSLPPVFFWPDGSVDTLRRVKLVYFKPGASDPEPGRYEITVRPLTGRIEVSELKD
jgi:hypothetical protein